MFCVSAMGMYMKPGSEASPEEDKKLALFYNFISAVFNPIIYSLQTRTLCKEGFPQDDRPGQFPGRTSWKGSWRTEKQDS